MDPLQIESLFPASYRETYFNTAGTALCPTPVRDEVKAFFDALGADPLRLFAEYPQRLERLRANLAEMLHASPTEIALTHHTAEGANIVANGIAWRPGDRILTLDHEYPSTIYPWMNLERRGLARLVLLKEEDARLDESRIVEAIVRERPRLFAISAVEWCSGYRFDLEPIGRACRQVGAFFFVDAAQSLGFWDLDTRRSDVSAAAGPACKWLLGPQGQGFLYLRSDALDEIRPVFVGGGSVVNSDLNTPYDLTFRTEARRFEYSSLNPSALVWFDAAVRFILEQVMASIRAHVFSLQDYALAELGAMGCALRGGGPPQRRSGIMAFRHPRIASEDLVRRLWKEQSVFTRLRDGFVRLSFHLYSTHRGVERLLDFVKAL